MIIEKRKFYIFVRRRYLILRILLRQRLNLQRDIQKAEEQPEEASPNREGKRGSNIVKVERSMRRGDIHPDSFSCEANTRRLRESPV